MKELANKIRQKGLFGTLKALRKIAFRPVYLFKSRKAEQYIGPSDIEHRIIEEKLGELGFSCQDYSVDLAAFLEFQKFICFPPNYHGGIRGGVWNEKLLEHFVASDFLEHFRNNRFTPYIDIAGGASPWALLLRSHGIEAYSIDLKIIPNLSLHEYYREENATKSSFSKESIGSVSLQCAYEMFTGNDDKNLLVELMRILKPNGRAVILPLYMHTHDCFYQSPDFFGQIFGDPEGKRYVRRDCWGIPISRKYSPETFKERILDQAIRLGFNVSLYVLRNKEKIADGIYLHFIFVLDKSR